MPSLDDRLALYFALGAIVFTTVGRLVLRTPESRHDLRASLAMWVVFVAATLATPYLRPALPATLDSLLAVVRDLSFGFAAVRLVVAVALAVRGVVKRAPVARIQHDVLTFALYAGVTLPIVKSRLNLDIGTVVGTSAVVSLVVGFALQETLGNLFAGISLQLEQPFAVGDFVRIGEHEGRVVQVAWRSTRIETYRRELITVPNTMVAKQAVVSFSTGRPVALDLELVTVPSVPPNLVRSEALAALKDCPGVLADPPPVVALVSEDGPLRYMVRIFLKNYGEAVAVKDEALTRLWYRMRRSGVGIPLPNFVTGANLARGPDARRSTAAILGEIDLFSPFPAEELESLAAAGAERSFGAGEHIVTEGDLGQSFFVVLAGRVSVRVGQPPEEVAQLPAGQAFGEMVMLTGEPRSASVVAVTDTTLLELDREAFGRHFTAHPERVAQLAALLENRKGELKAASDRAAAGKGGGTILERLRRVFGIS